VAGAGQRPVSGSAPPTSRHERFGP
jgi:hypothetical protein